MVAARYAVQNVQTERYRLGSAAYLLGRAAERTLGFDEAMPLLERLSESTGESVNLVIRDGEGLVVLRVESQHPLRLSNRLARGSRCTAPVPAKCCSRSPATCMEAARLGELNQLTPTTITSPRELLQDLKEIRKRGFSINRGERIPGVYGVAAPVLTTDGVASTALAVQGPQIRIPDDGIPRLGLLVIETAQAIAAIMPSGYQL